VLYYWLVRKIDVTKSMLISLVTPIVAVIVGMIVLGEKLNWRTLLGGAMIIFGIGFIVTLHRKTGTAAVPSEKYDTKVFKEI